MIGVLTSPGPRCRRPCTRANCNRLVDVLRTHLVRWRSAFGPADHAALGFGGPEARIQRQAADGDSTGTQENAPREVGVETADFRTLLNEAHKAIPLRLVLSKRPSLKTFS